MMQAPDFLHPTLFKNTKLYDQLPHTLIWLPDQDPEWKSVHACGNFPCTGPKNVQIRFEGYTNLYQTKNVKNSDTGEISVEVV